MGASIITMDDDKFRHCMKFAGVDPDSMLCKLIVTAAAWVRDIREDKRRDVLELILMVSEQLPSQLELKCIGEIAQNKEHN